MRKYIFAFLCIAILSYTTGFAQTETDPKNSSLVFSIGYNSGSLKNLVFAPVSRYDYNGLVYQLKYASTSKKENLFEIQLDYLNSELKSDLIPVLNANYSKIVLNFSYLKQVYNKNKLAIHVGLQSQTNVSSYINWKAYDFQQKLGVAGRLTFQADEKQTLSSKLTLPFLMWRTSTFEENFYSLKSYQSLLWSTEYKYKLSNHFDFNVNYNFNYDRLQISNAYRELQHQINLGINFKF
ncbi:MAG: hypothetical protein COA50_10110 [Flavobacteriaceae bacterium]|nr:MAG: hypothetical protein COA50_10110 [Flavobacteriaceae bacterium]